jgi:hypothetical protein
MGRRVLSEDIQRYPSCGPFAEATGDAVVCDWLAPRTPPLPQPTVEARMQASAPAAREEAVRTGRVEAGVVAFDSLQREDAVIFGAWSCILLLQVLTGDLGKYGGEIPLQDTSSNVQEQVIKSDRL